MAQSQTVKFINVARSYFPMDPNSFPDSMHVADMKEEERYPVMVYDGYNFMPTSYGYRSYFGTAKKLGIDLLVEKVDAIFIFQNQQLNNTVVALADTGIWIKDGSVAGAWTQEVALDGIATTTSHYKWTYAVINNELHLYRQNHTSFWTMRSIVAAPGFEIEERTPNFLNLEAQQGIFRAGDRLGFWDSANSVGWSNLDDFEDFTPDLETLAGNVIFSQIIGRIVNILSHGNGFVIYCTKSVIHIEQNTDSMYLWKPNRILQDTGIAYSRECVAALPDTTHYAYTATGLYEITNGQASIIVPEASDFFRLTETPKYLQLIEGRHLFFPIMDEDFVNATAQYTEEILPEETITFPVIEFPTTDMDELTAGMDDGSITGYGVCELFTGVTTGAFLGTDRWEIVASGIDLESGAWLRIYDAETGDLLGALNTISAIDGPYSYSRRATHSGAVRMEWQTSSPNAVSLTVLFRGEVKAIIGATGAEMGQATYEYL